MKLYAYQALSSLAGLLAWPLFYYHLKSRGQGESFLPRLGLRPPPPPPSGTPRVWIHGVSVGEILAAVPLVVHLRQLRPQIGLIVSTGTETGQAVARQQFLPLGARVCYFPLDLPWAVSQALNVLKPDVFVSLESEVWPTFLTAARRRGVRLALMNARLSDRSFRRYLAYKKYLLDFINLFEIIAAGSREDHRRLASLGLPAPKLVFSGNLKVDALLARRAQTQASAPPSLSGAAPGTSHRTNLDSASLREVLNLKGEPVILAASTHPGEEEVVLAAYETLKVPYPTLLLFLAPRHPERTPKVSGLLARYGCAFQRWQTLKSRAEMRHQPVVLIDTVGDLFALYAVADVAFVGGSLVPRGGQNLLEPAAWGLAPLYGPYVENFRWAEEILRHAGAGILVRDAPSLAAATRRLLDDSGERRRLGQAAWAALNPHRGAARRQAELILTLWLKGLSDPRGGKAAGPPASPLPQ
ncbi:MAG: 3-deoxy-D-manno-octulosonic acid transferase [Desulfobaccales bacterium]